jgi:alanine racemase
VDFLRIERPTIAEIDLDALLANYRTLKSLANGAQTLAVVKADAYGHGAVEVTRALVAAGCADFAVATLGEAHRLRAAGIRERVYVMGGFFPEQAEQIVALELTPFVIDRSGIASIGAAVRELGRSRFPIHLKLDTGASRLGVTEDELEGAIEELKRNPALKLEGVCTLLTNAGDPKSPVTDRQLATFSRMVEILEANGFRGLKRHVANSAATVLRKDCHFDLFRPGLALYGLSPVPAVGRKAQLRPVMTFKTRVLQTKRIPVGTGVSYGHTFVAARPTIVGVLPVGYADGYRRGLQHGGKVLIRNRRAPVIGAVCMDLTMIDLTDVPDAIVGDDVILWGGNGAASISVNEIARLVRTISYELLSTVGKRVPRFYRGQSAEPAATELIAVKVQHGSA